MSFCDNFFGDEEPTMGLYDINEINIFDFEKPVDIKEVGSELSLSKAIDASTGTSSQLKLENLLKNKATT